MYHSRIPYCRRSPARTNKSTKPTTCTDYRLGSIRRFSSRTACFPHSIIPWLVISSPFKVMGCLEPRKKFWHMESSTKYGWETKSQRPLRHFYGAHEPSRLHAYAWQWWDPKKCSLFSKSGYLRIMLYCFSHGAFSKFPRSSYRIQRDLIECWEHVPTFKEMVSSDSSSLSFWRLSPRM